MKNVIPSWNWRIALVVVSATLLGAGTQAVGQQVRALGIDVSAWQGNIPAANWATLKRATNAQVSGVYGDGKDFVMIRSSRGGTTGEDHRQGGYAAGNNTFYNLSQRYDDLYFVQNINRATAAGLFAGPYHYGRADVLASTLNSDGTTTAGVANNGTDEANHFIQMAGAWMRPGYMLPTFDLEAGGGDQTSFSLDFSDRIYAVMGIRPIMYTGGNYTPYLQSSIVNRFPNLWYPRYANQSSPDTIPVQTANPNDFPPVNYGPWDDFGNSQPWAFWQYASTARLNGINNKASNVDVDVAHGGIEFVKDILVPAFWMNDSDGQWTTLLNWNSGQTPQAPVPGSGQVTPVGTQTLPTTRLPGINDTVILDRPGAAITVTLASGAQTIRKLYVRETLNITGGSLSINYVPSWDSTTNGAQFSSPVTLSGSASLSVHTLQVDATRTFTLSGGTLTFNTINLMPHSTTPAKMLMSGDVSLNALSNVTATIAKGTGSGSSGLIDLGGGNRSWNVANGSADVDLSVDVPVSNGALAKTGPGTMRLGVANAYSGGTTISAGILEGGVASSIPGDVTNSAGTLKLDNASTLASGAALALASSPSAGAVNLNFSGTQTVSALYFGTTRKAAGTWAASGATHNNAAFTGSGRLNVTTGPASSTAVTLTSGSSPSTYGDSLTFTATITGNSPGGTVQFKVDGVAVGSPVTLVGGSASLVVSTLSVSGSPHQITAYYGGDDNNNPSNSSASPVSQAIAAKTLIVILKGSVSKSYDGTTAATLAAGNYWLLGVLGGDTVNLNNPASGIYDTRNAGSSKLVGVTGLAISGLSSTNYTLSFISVSSFIGTISQTNLTVTAAPNTKTYDGTTSALATPTVTAGSIQTGDSAPAWTETYDTKNAGTGKPLTPAGTVSDGNGGANYNVTYANNTSGVITALTTSSLLASSVNPSGPGSNVTFTIAVSGVPPAADLPPGDVIFSANGTPFATNALVSGSISASTDSLPLGTNAMTAQYVGGGNFLGSTGSVAQAVKLFVTCSQTNALLSLADNLDGTSTLTFVGTPQAEYYLLASPDVAAPMTSWAPVAGSTNTVTNVSGLWQFTLTNTPPQQFYRSTAVVPCP